MVKSVPTWLRALKNLDVSAAHTVEGWMFTHMCISHICVVIYHCKIYFVNQSLPKPCRYLMVRKPNVPSLHVHVMYSGKLGVLAIVSHTLCTRAQ